MYELAEKAARRRPTPTKRAQFLAGFFYGVSNKLSGQRESTILEDSKFAIVLSNQEAAREKYARENAGPTRAISLREPGRRNWSALESGFREGRRTSINPELLESPSRLPLSKKSRSHYRSKRIPSCRRTISSATDLNDDMWSAKSPGSASSIKASPFGKNYGCRKGASRASEKG